MDMKRKLEIMKQIERANQRRLDEWKEKKEMNINTDINTAFVAEQKERIAEIADLLIVIQSGIANGHVASATAANSIGVAIDSLQGIASAMNSITSLVKAADRAE